MKRAPLPRRLGVVGQVRAALSPANRLASALGFLLGGFVPAATYVVAHRELAAGALWAQLGTYLVAGGLLYSARTVFDWGTLAFGLRVKALGFVVLLEGVMVTAHTAWLAGAALGYLVAINGAATACKLSLGDRS